MARRRGQAWVRIALSLLALLGVLGILSVAGSFNLKELLKTLSTFSPQWIWAAAGVSTLQVFVQLIRIWVSFEPSERPSTRELARTAAIGQLLNSVAPLRSGDPYKVLRLSTLGIPVAAVIAALLVERAGDGAALLLAAGVSSFPELSGLLQRVSLPLGPLCLGVGSAGVVLGLVRVTAPHWIKRTVQSLRHFLKRLGRMMVTRPFALAFLVSLFTWFLDAGTLFCSARAGGAPLALAQCMSCVFILNLGLAIPLTVANVGVFEASLGFALMAKGLAAPQALGIAAVEHLMKIVGLVLCIAILEAALKFTSPALRTPRVKASVRRR